MAIQIDTYAVLGGFVFHHEVAARLMLLRREDARIGAGGIAAGRLRCTFSSKR